MDATTRWFVAKRHGTFRGIVHASPALHELQARGVNLVQAIHDHGVAEARHWLDRWVGFTCYAVAVAMICALIDSGTSAATGFLGFVEVLLNPASHRLPVLLVSAFVMALMLSVSVVQVFLMFRQETTPSTQRLLKTLSVMVADIEIVDERAWKTPAARQHMCSQLETAARELEGTVELFANSDDAWGSEITEEMRQRGNYLRSFKSPLFSPTDTSRAEMVRQLTPLLALMAEGRWLELPKSEDSKPRTTGGSTVRTWSLALLLTLALVAAQQFLGTWAWAGAAIPALLGLPLARLLKRLNLTINDVIQG